MKQQRLILSSVIGLLSIILLGLVTWKYVLPRPEVFIRKVSKGQFQLFVQGEPYLVKGVVYQPIPIGHHHQYNFWADPNQPWIVDGDLMRQMGANAVRFFQAGEDARQTKKVIGHLYQNYGIRTIMGHWMDYWSPGNYADQKYRRDLTARVLEMVKTYKDEPGLLLWILGNENNLSWHSGARISWSCSEVKGVQDPYMKEKALAKIYYSLVNRIACEIKKLDPNHPVALGNADSYTLEVAKEVCPDIDLVAVTAYRGKSLGNLWREVKSKMNKPVLIMEFGCDSFNAKDDKEDQEMQSAFIRSQWEDIQRNVFGGTGEGNALGGCIFEWNDEWWKHDEHMVASWFEHNTEAAWSCGGYYFDIAAPNNMNINEEWWGIVALSPTLEKGINKRIPRQAYFELQRLWK